MILDNMVRVKILYTMIRVMIIYTMVGVMIISLQTQQIQRRLATQGGNVIATASL